MKAISTMVDTTVPSRACGRSSSYPLHYRNVWLFSGYELEYSSLLPQRQEQAVTWEEEYSETRSLGNADKAVLVWSFCHTQLSFVSSDSAMCFVIILQGGHSTQSQLHAVKTPL